MNLRHATRQFLAKCGLEVHLRRNVERHAMRTWTEKQFAMWRPFLAHRDIRTVIDVGANEGQFATLAHRLCPNATIVAFEPIPACHPELNRVLAAIPGATLFPVALGDSATRAWMNRSRFTPCSSLLAGTENLGEDYPDAAVIDKMEVQIARLDDILDAEALEPDVLIKLDVQGFEIPVIRGGPRVFSKACIVVTEVCFFRKLYANQPLFDDVYREIYDHGFQYRGNAEQMSRTSDGRIVEADAIFERDENASFGSR